MEPDDICIKGKLLNQYILSFLLIFTIGFLFNIIYEQDTYVYIYLGVSTILIAFLFSKDKLKNNTFVRFSILLILSLFIFFFDSYYSSEGMVYLSYISVVGTFPIVFDLRHDYKYVILLFMLFVAEVSINVFTDYLLFTKEGLTVYDIELRRINEVFQLLLFILMNVYFIYQLQVGRFSVDEKETKHQEKFVKENVPTINDLHKLAVAKDPSLMIEFKKVFPCFEKKLLQLAPNMIISELEICVFIKLKMTTKEIATYSNLTIRAVEGKKYRIRKKLSLEKEVDLSIFISKI